MEGPNLKSFSLRDSSSVPGHTVNPGPATTTPATINAIFIVFEKWLGGAKFGHSGAASQILGVFSNRDEANKWAAEYVRELEAETKKKVYAREDNGNEAGEGIFIGSYRSTEEKMDQNGCVSWKVHWYHTTRVWVLEEHIYEKAEDLPKPCQLYKPDV